MPPAPPRPVVDPALLNGPDATTRWTNLGFWRDTTSYAAAAAELARQVGRAIKLHHSDQVLDLACGHGDSLAMWVREFDVRKVVGVEPDPALVATTTARVTGWGLAERIHLRRGEAESFDARECSGVTAVVCVDAAYHFDTRRRWLQQLADTVPSGTRLGLADLLVTARGRNDQWLHGVASRAGIPGVNLWSAHAVEATLADTGWLLERMVRCGPDVLRGFARHAARSALHWGRRPGAGGWRALGTAAAIAMAVGKLDYAIISARRA